MRNIKLTLAYDGTFYHGWQVQPGKSTVCGVLKETLLSLTGEQAAVHASSRTDSGVHAVSQVVNFRTESAIPASNLQAALNGMLPGDISVTRAQEAPDNFHACYDARSRSYRYTIFNSPVRSPFDRMYAYHCPYVIDHEQMAAAAGFIRGKHDFSAFKSARGEKNNRVRTVIRAEVARRGDYIYIEVQADGFLTYMVRNIAGTLLEAGRGRIRPGRVKHILESKDRHNAGPTLPARGLCLVNVEYHGPGSSE